MTKLIARLWYTPGSRTFSPDLLKKRLTDNLGCTVEKIDGDMPVLHVTAPTELFLRIENHDNIGAEASELAAQIGDGAGLNPASAKLKSCTRCLDIGAPDGTDPQDGTVKGILTGLTSGLDGVLQDMVHGRLSLAPRQKKKSLMQRMLGR